jgi:hypothetical protein
MVLSKQNNGQLYDEIRKKWVAATPEEIVRQTLLQKLVNSLGFPRELIAIEKALSEIPQISSQVPDRRIDVIVFYKGKQFSPLLLIECKQGSEKGAIEQLMGYNHFVQAPFIAVIDQDAITFGFKESGSYRFIPYIPSYVELVKAIT